MAETARDELFLVPHTHWDREWYEPFDRFRERLIEMMDVLIELADREPGFAHFHLDGQAALIDDYLEARPARESDVRRLAKEGRISVGPWYTQMDEFLVSGESHIRNLEWGMARARELGAAAPIAGYLPDQFGHIGQMPQILQRGGLGRAVVWRGVPSAVDRTAFWWEGADGSRVLTEYLAFGYSIGAHVGQCQDAESLRIALAQAAEWIRPYSPRRRLLLTVGTDHTVPAARLAPLLEDVNRDGGLQAQIGSLSDYLRSEEPAGELPAWRGELRSAARAHLLPNVYSARVDQKRRRGRVEALVERYAEPLAALVPGFAWPEEELRRAWRLLLWNGAHDSVCGCSVDKVARDVDARFDEAEALATQIRDDALQSLASRMSATGWMYFNPSPFERGGVPGLGWWVGPEDPYKGPVPFHPPIALEERRGGVLAGEFMLRLVDEGDVGDLYTFCPSPDSPPRDPAFFGRLGDSLIATFDDGLLVEMRAERRPESPSVYLHLRIQNDRPDHRLRLHVSTDSAQGSVALSPFEVVHRPLASEGGTEVPSHTWPARGAVAAGGAGLLQEGVFEYEVIPDPPELAVTLLRCIGTISRPQLATRAWAAGPDLPTPEAQMIGEHRVSLTLHRALRSDELPAAWERAHLVMHAVRAPGGGDLPDRGSLLAIEGAELSAVRKVDGRVQVRIWNPSLEPRTAQVAGRAIELGPAKIADVEL
jgi:alpha-mannosidase